MINNIIGKNLYFVVDEEASHIEPLKQNNFYSKTINYQKEQKIY